MQRKNCFSFSFPGCPLNFGWKEDNLSDCVFDIALSEADRLPGPSGNMTPERM